MRHDSFEGRRSDPGGARGHTLDGRFVWAYRATTGAGAGPSRLKIDERSLRRFCGVDSRPGGKAATGPGGWWPQAGGINVAAMSSEPDKRHRFDPPFAEIQARQMGELVRGESRWEVLLEVARDDDVGALRGRMHFVSGNTHRLSGWIFLEWAAKDIEARFGEFSAQELWNLLDSLA